MKIRLGSALVMLAAVLPLPAVAQEDDKRETIDCGETDMEFAGERFEVECIEFEGHQIHQSDGSAQVQVNVLLAESTRSPDWLLAYDSRILGSLAIRRIGIQDNIQSYFGKLPIKEWKSVGDVQDFETAEFVSIDNDEVQDCVAFQRFFNRRYNGFSRWVVGVSCSSDGKEVAYKTLAGFSGPGG